jgi:hypothetical protein
MGSGSNPFPFIFSWLSQGALICDCHEPFRTELARGGGCANPPTGEGALGNETRRFLYFEVWAAARSDVPARRTTSTMVTTGLPASRSTVTVA